MYVCAYSQSWFSRHPCRTLIVSYTLGMFLWLWHWTTHYPYRRVHDYWQSGLQLTGKSTVWFICRLLSFIAFSSDLVIAWLLCIGWRRLISGFVLQHMAWPCKAHYLQRFCDWCSSRASFDLHHASRRSCRFSACIGLSLAQVKIQLKCYFMSSNGFSSCVADKAGYCLTISQSLKELKGHVLGNIYQLKSTRCHWNIWLCQSSQLQLGLDHQKHANSTVLVECRLPRIDKCFNSGTQCTPSRTSAPSGRYWMLYRVLQDNNVDL